jgi:hypothetical protein
MGRGGSWFCARSRERLAAAAAAGLNAQMLVARLDSRQFQNRRIFYHYIRARTAAIASSLGHPTLDPVQDLRRLLSVLRSGGQIVAAIDVPSDQVSASMRVQIAGQTARVPRGLLKMAVEQGLPVSVFVTGIDLETGRRFLRIHALGVHDEVDTLLRCSPIYSNPKPAAWYRSESERLNPFQRSTARRNPPSPEAMRACSCCGISAATQAGAA